ncbi:MAG TPA: DUF6510 family protein [Gaiella sp.]|uniref:DUF6510 family protein n=1 Tax=Gaiella sp. TaxID=2663207 RepID=UPI002D80245C|nr:DUF6510 family protein [Gaiella sp.]HET9286423.1 DUF6510 family protein [Gaiella sp.]
MADVAVTTLDGNAIAGLLADVFGQEMTLATGTCASCGASGEVGTFVVYTRAPGTVARCPACTSVLMVLVTVRNVTCVDLRGLAALDLTR